MSDSDDTANHFDESFQGDSGEQSHPEGSQSTGGASPSTKNSGNYKIPLILGAIGLLLMISRSSIRRTSTQPSVEVVPMMFQRVGPSVWALYHLTPPGLILLGLASSSDSRRCCPIPAAARTRSLCLAEPGSVRLPWPRPRCERQGPRSGTMDP